jgi:arylsulfatase A-like enzyme
MMNWKYLLTGVLAGSTLALRAAGEAKDERPNILFILSDDHTSQTWGIYGGILSEYAQTENIRRLADEGAVLDNCFCTSSISTPSRAAILTGRYSHCNGVYTLDDTLDVSLPTFAKESFEQMWKKGKVK